MIPPIRQHDFAAGGPYLGTDHAPVVHALFGWRQMPQIHYGPVYDVTTGQIATIEEMLADPFHYRGTPRHVPAEMLHWVYFAAASIDASWRGLSISLPEGERGFAWEDVGDGLTEIPIDAENPADRNRFQVYQPGTDYDDEPDGSYPHPSVFSQAMRELASFDTSKFRARLITNDRLLVSVTSTAAEGIETTGNIDTGIPLDGGGTYLLEYRRITGAASSALTFEAGNTGTVADSPYFYADYGIFSPYVSVTGFDTDITQATEILEDDLFDLLYNDASHPEYRESIDSVIASLQADDTASTTLPTPLGRARFSIAAPADLPEGTDYSGTITCEATVLRQLPAYLEFELPSAAA